MFNRRLFTTRFNQATDTSGESITVIINNIDENGKKLSRKQKTISYDYKFDALDNHVYAVETVTECEDFAMFKHLKRGYQFVELSQEESENINLYL